MHYFGEGLIIEGPKMRENFVFQNGLVISDNKTV